MLVIVFHVSIISLLMAGLASLIVIADKYVSDYGQCDIIINDQENDKLEVQGGGTLLETLKQQQIFIPSACGGRGTCGECKLTIKEGAGPLLPTEEPYLEQEERDQGKRLACQVKARENLRIAIPEELLKIQEYQCVCEQVRDLTHDIKEFRLKLREPGEISYTPGQYIQLLAPAYEGNEEVYRAYSISSDPAEKDAVELVIRLVPGGICTTYCFKYLNEGTEVNINGPYGDFHLTNNEAPCLFIAGGSGMAPIKCILHQMKNEGISRPVTYFFGANLVKELFYVDLMRQFESELPNFQFVPVVAEPEEGEEWDGETGLVTDTLNRRLADASEYEAYLCGSPGMIDAVIKVLKEKGVHQDKIFYDKFA